MSELRQTGHLNREERRIKSLDVSDWKVLVVDDQPDNIQVVELTLNFHGAEVVTAENGVAGLKALETFTPNLIILDLSMPEMTGWEMFQQLKTYPTHANTPVIALTAHAMDGDKELVLKAGFAGYISKPFSVVTLMTDIQNILEKHKQEA